MSKKLRIFFFLNYLPSFQQLSRAIMALENTEWKRKGESKWPRSHI